MTAICDWRGRDNTVDDFAIDGEGRIIPPHLPCTRGYMGNMLNICQTQIHAAYLQNMRSVPATMSLDGWLHTVELGTGRPLNEQEKLHWRALIGPFFGSLDRVERRINEGGFVLRFIEWLQPRLQRQWYVRLYGKALMASQDLTPAHDPYTNAFLRLMLPGTMTPPTVPSILPFNTVR